MFSRNDFWAQVRRTIMGRPMNGDELEVLVTHLRDQLLLGRHDVLLDLGCGNGALSAELFEACSGCVGADLSSYLIGVARQYFERIPDYVFFHADALEFALSVGEPGRFTKALCYAVIPYLPLDEVRAIVQVLYRRFSGISRLVLGNIPDRDKAGLFFRDGYDRDILDQHESQIGRWWSHDEVASIASAAGWDVTFVHMPEHFFNARYRFDAVLTRL